MEQVQKEIREIDELERSDEQELAEIKKRETEVKQEVAKKMDQQFQVRVVHKMENSKATQAAMEASEKLFSELKNKGTLRNAIQEHKVPQGDLSPEEIIKKGVEKQKTRLEK